MKRLIIVALASAACLVGGERFAAADPIVIGAPPEPAASNCFPFGCQGGTRYQQVYNRNQFAGPIVITEVQFYHSVAPPGTRGALNVGTYEFYLSTTSREVDALDTRNFDRNLGPDNARFSVVELVGQAAPPVLSIVGSAFSYDPARGNLLLDIIIPGGVREAGDGFLDARRNAGGVFSRAHDFGVGFEGYGLVTGFVGDQAPIPEPGSLLLISGAALVAGARARTRARRAAR